ncbi:MAG: glycosyltransferase [Candidatus Baldrarchaeia archaeon]
MEVMACGKPVVVTSVGNVLFLVKNGVNGIAKR